MNLTTVNVAIPVQLLIGVPLPGGSVRFELTKADISGGALVLPKAVTVALPADGSTATAQLCPNTVGTQGSQTKFTILDQAGVEQYSGLATVPNFNCSLPDIITSLAPSTVTDAQAAVNLARAWAVQDPAPVDGVDYSARHHALAAKADRQQADLDAAATAADRTQTGLDVIGANAARDQSNTARDQSNTARDTAIAQASLAAGYAAGAGSVSQQDLSGVAGGALHRSPNAVTALFVYDTSKDSDGGAWVDRMTDRSWMTEALNGKWLGAQASEAAARAVSGAATGDYFQLTTDGKFYKLSAGAGTVETFRGNVAKFPRLAAIVRDLGRATIYDLTQPGRPMWMAFDAQGTNLLPLYAPATGASACALNGVLVVGATTGSSNGYAVVISFVADRAIQGRVAGSGNVGRRYSGTIAQRNAGLSYAGSTDAGYALASNDVNAVAMTTMPDAPVDPVTGLQVPTIAVATAGGVSVLKHDGSVVSSASASSMATVSVNPYLLTANAGSTGFYALAPSKLGAAFTLSALSLGAAPDFIRGSISRALVGARGKFARVDSAGRLALMWFNESSPAASVTAQITDTANTGCMVGDIRRALMCDTVAGVVGAELSSGAWYVPASYLNTISAASPSGFSASLSGTTQSRAAEALATVANQDYTVTLTCNVSTVNLFVRDQGDVGTILNTFVPVAGVPTTYTFRAASAATYLVFAENAGGAFTISGLSVKATVSDRSYKAKPSAIVGTLTKAAVGVGSQLVAYSGFSAANYIREAYSADLDVASLALPAWVKYSTAAAGTIIERSAATGALWGIYTDATGKLVATVSDGTTTRTATSTLAYNTGQWLQVMLTYSAGTVSLWVNGVVVATATGAALGSLANASAVLTVGNNFALTSAFPSTDSISIIDVGATLPSATAAAWIYAQEAEMFQPGAQVTLPDAGVLVDVSYDDRLAALLAASAANESAFPGLVRTASAPAAAGSISKIAGTSGAKLLARTTTNPGVDVTLPAQNLKEELLRRAEDAARAQRATPRVFDFDATASQADFPLQPGYEALEVIAARSSQREGASKDWQRKFDGFQETVSMNTGQSLNTWMQVIARRTA